MRQVNGFWVPDYDRDMEANIAARPQFAGRGTYQFYLFARAVPLIKDFRHALDIGAHIGTWSYMLGRCFGCVSAFEPVPSHIECFRRNLYENIYDWPPVHLYEVALGERDAAVCMAIREPISLKARIRTDEVGESVEVPMVTLDSQELVDLDLVKIDCEGYEVKVLEGGEKTIRRDRPMVIVEQKPNNTKRYGFRDLAAVELLESWGARLAFKYHGGDYCMTWDDKNAA